MSSIRSVPPPYSAHGASTPPHSRRANAPVQPHIPLLSPWSSSPNPYRSFQPPSVNEYGAIPQNGLTVKPPPRFHPRSRSRLALFAALLLAVFAIPALLWRSHAQHPHGAHWCALTPTETCSQVGVRTFSATLRGLPPAWADRKDATCTLVRARLPDGALAVPDTCDVIVHDGEEVIVGMWDTHGNEHCMPAFSNEHSYCSEVGTRLHVARVHFPDGLDPIAACRRTPHSRHFPAVNLSEESNIKEDNEELLFPDECILENAGVTAHWYRTGARVGCTPQWDPISPEPDGQCPTYGHRRFTARLVSASVPSTLDSYAACRSTPALVNKRQRWLMPDECEEVERGKGECRSVCRSLGRLRIRDVTMAIEESKC